MALAQFVALKNPGEGTEAAKKKKEMNEVKAGLVDALTQKCRALVEMLPKVHFCAYSNVHMKHTPICVFNSKFIGHICVQSDVLRL